MMRFLFILSAVVAAVLAFIMQWPWLYAGAALLLLAAVGMLASDLLRAHRRTQKPYQRASSSRDDELSTLGIMEIREKKKGPSPSKPVPKRKASVEGEQGREGRARVLSKVERPAAPSPRPSEKNSAQPHNRNGRDKPPARKPMKRDDGVLEAYLHAIRAVLGAHTVCLLLQEEVALTYRIEAIVGPDDHRPRGASFSTEAPLLTATMSRQAATVQPVGGHGVAPESLGYYRGEAPARLQHVALAPVPRPGKPVTAFLMADATAPDFGSRRQQILLARFAEVMTLVLEAHPPSTAPPEGAETQQEHVSHEEPPEDEAPPPEDAPRPRRDIIAEEMEKARAEGRDLALALVYLTRAEALAEKGEAILAAAEEALQTRLHEVTPRGRIVPFGELTYGIFYDAPVAEVETWALTLEHELARAEGVLEGGVSIGLVMLQERHQTPDDLRRDATSALEEAYASGTCTILE